MLTAPYLHHTAKRGLDLEPALHSGLLLAVLCQPVALESSNPSEAE